jgi:mRNA-degrading endonuclease RelE of RelBE toxin-antitoxin system
MFYEIEIKPRAIKDCKKMPQDVVQQIFTKIEDMSDDLKGQVKQLTNHTPES